MDLSSTVMLCLFWILLGGIVGVAARAIFPGRHAMGWAGTVALGVAGSFMGGILANIIVGSGAIFAMHATGLIGSIIGAVVVLGVFAHIRPTLVVRPREDAR